MPIEDLSFILPPDKKLPQNTSCFSAGVLCRIKNEKIQFLFIEYTTNERTDREKVSIKFPGGAIKKTNETSRDVLVREFEEEVGVKIFSSELVYAIRKTDDTTGGFHIQYFFAITRVHGQVAEERKGSFDSETGSPQWMDADDLKSKIFHTHKKALYYASAYFALRDDVFCKKALEAGLLDINNMPENYREPLYLKVAKLSSDSRVFDLAFGVGLIQDANYY